MPAAKLSIEDWKEVQRASEMGVDDKTLEADYGVSQLAIRQRRWREKWITPALLKAEVESQKVKRKLMGSGNGKLLKKEGDITPVTKTALESAADTISRLAERNGLRVAQMADKALRGVADSPPEIETWSDATQAYKMLRLAAGLDKEGSNTVVNLGAFWSPPSSQAEKPVVVVEAEKP